MTATTFTHGSPLVAPATGKGTSKGAPKTSNSFFGSLVATFWLWADTMSEAHAMAREAHERLPFADW
jgi:hypothetical protein